MRALFSMAFMICVVLIRVQAHAQQPAVPAAPPVPPPPYGTPIMLEQAKKAAGVAEAEARRRNLRVAIAIVEPSGDLVYFQRMDGVDYASIKIAQTKAVSAAIFRRPSSNWISRR